MGKARPRTSVEQPQKRRCIHCLVLKELTEFWPKTKEGKYASTCKVCSRIRWRYNNSYKYTKHYKNWATLPDNIKFTF